MHMHMCLPAHTCTGESIRIKRCSSSALKRSQQQTLCFLDITFVRKSPWSSCATVKLTYLFPKSHQSIRTRYYLLLSTIIFLIYPIHNALNDEAFNLSPNEINIRKHTPTHTHTHTHTHTLTHRS